MFNNPVCVLYKSKSLPEDQSPRRATKPSSSLVRPARVDPLTFSPMCDISPIKSQESHWTVSDQTGLKPSGVSAAGVQLSFISVPYSCFSRAPVSILYNVTSVVCTVYKVVLMNWCVPAAVEGFWRDSLSVGCFSIVTHIVCEQEECPPPDVRLHGWRQQKITSFVSACSPAKTHSYTSTLSKDVSVRQVDCYRWRLCSMSHMVVQ